MKYIILTIIILILITGCNTKPMVGNDKDQHGCIGSAGYTWCESKLECLRTWEEECPEDKLTGEEKAKEIAKGFVKEMNEYKDYKGEELEITNIDSAECPGCWLIDTEFLLTPPESKNKSKAIVKLTLVDWKVSRAERSDVETDIPIDEKKYESENNKEYISEDNNKEYISEDLEKCTVIDYACEEGIPFQDEFGCGCKIE